MKNLRKTKITLIICEIILIVLPIIIKLSNVKASDTVRLSLVPQPYIDVAISKEKTATNLNNFKADLLKKLGELNVKTENVKISEVESYNVNIQDAFNWNQDLDTSIGNISIENNGQNVTMVGNRTLPGKNAIWIIPDEDMNQTFTFNYNINYGDSFTAAGMLLKVKQTGNTLTGYILSFNNPGGISFPAGTKTWYQYADNQLGAIWEFSYNIGENSSPITKTLKKTIPIQKSGELTVKTTKTQIEISGGGLTDIVTYELEEQMGTGFGFFAEHYAHGCDLIGSFTLTNINLTSESFKTFEEVLREPDWRDNSIKVLVDVNDYENAELNKPTTLGEVITRTLNDELHYLGWGQSVNKTQMETFIASNNSNGKFIDNTDYQNSINKTAEYIKSLIDKMQSTDYVILGENTILANSNETIMKNTAGGNYPYGRWKILHDYTYYENNIGQFANSGKYISDMITSFDKTGKYVIYYEDKQVHPTQIYVHRRPVAKMDLKRTGDTIQLTSLSYDLDQQSKNNGIQREEWKYKKIGETNWRDGKLTNVSDGGTYVVQLRVLDWQNAWSAPVTGYVTSSSDAKPIADFTISKQENSIYEQLQIEDKSYDPYGGSITSRTWVVYKGDTQIYTGSTPLTNYQRYGIGDYKMSLTVTNNRGIKSDTFTRTFKIIEDNIGPECIITPTECDWSKSVNISVKFTDPLGSGFKDYQYAITQSQASPSQWSPKITKSTDTITINTVGTWYLHIKATDNAGNTSTQRVAGPYKIDNTPPTASISHTPEDWVIDNVTINWSFTDTQSGIDYIILPNGNRTNDTSGEYVVGENGDYTFKAYDKVGNEKIVNKKINNIDKIAPNGVLSISNNELTDNPIQITWEVYDDQSGISKVILPDSSTSNQTRGTFPVSKIGKYTFVVYDKVGNNREISIEVNNVDMEKPTLVVTQKLTKWTNEDIILDWEAKDNQSGLREVVFPNSEKTNEENGEYVVTQNGEYTFLAFDKIGNGIMARHTVNNIDKTAPLLKLKRDYDSDDNIKIIWEMSDTQSGIRNLVLPNGENTSKTEGEFIVKQNGGYTFIAYDNVGNSTIMKIEISDIDKEGIKFDLWQEKIDNEHYKIMWKILEGQNDFKNILLPNSIYSENGQGDFIVEKEGTYTFLAYDRAGNETKRTVTITK